MDVLYPEEWMKFPSIKKMPTYLLWLASWSWTFSTLPLAALLLPVNELGACRSDVWLRFPPEVWSLMYCNKHHVMRGQKKERECGFFEKKKTKVRQREEHTHVRKLLRARSQKIISFYYVQQVEAFAQEIDIWTHDTAWRHMHKSTRNILLCKCL